jgi:hypothetical protein
VEPAAVAPARAFGVIVPQLTVATMTATAVRKAENLLETPEWRTLTNR